MRHPLALAVVPAALLLTACGSVGLGIGVPLGPLSFGIGIGGGGVSLGVGAGVGPVGVGVGVNSQGQVTGGVGVAASVPLGHARVAAGVGTGAVLFDPLRAAGAPVLPQPGAAQPASAGEQGAP